jgi:hypothetical protein
MEIGNEPNERMMVGGEIFLNLAQAVIPLLQ